MKNQIFDCITFFRENFITNVRFEILNKYVDYFVICESKFDHNGKKKKLNFKLKNLSFKNKIIYIVLDHPFPKHLKDGWQRQAYQRDYMLSKILNANAITRCILYCLPLISVAKCPLELQPLITFHFFNFL
jgi:beta-1,4-mannosyl-glycoprotein beta-1,4-N-acetylglucosaminyltransferase